MDAERIRYFRTMTSDTSVQLLLDECLDEIEKSNFENRRMWSLWQDWKDVLRTNMTEEEWAKSLKGGRNE